MESSCRRLTSARELGEMKLQDERTSLGTEPKGYLHQDGGSGWPPRCIELGTRQQRRRSPIPRARGARFTRTTMWISDMVLEDLDPTILAAPQVSRLHIVSVFPTHTGWQVVPIPRGRRSQSQSQCLPSWSIDR